MDSILRSLDFLFRIEEFAYCYLKNLISKPPPLPDAIVNLVTNNFEVFFECNPDINSINNYLCKNIAAQNKNAEEKLMEKAGHISNLSGLSIKSLRSIIYDNEKITGVKVINWLQFKSKIFILEVAIEIPAKSYQFLKRYKTLKIKKYYYFLERSTK